VIEVRERSSSSLPISLGLTLALLLAGCGGGGGTPDAQGPASVQRLPQRVRPAADVLVRLERAIRDHDARTLCTEIYERSSIEGGVAECIRSATRLSHAETEFRLSVQRVVLRGGSGTATTKVTFRDSNGEHHQHEIFQLVKSPSGWKVRLIS
jgi:hypothetical protein